MNTRADRRAISGLLLRYFPQMDKATSDEWHALLNEVTGLTVGLSELNGSAFDQWRKALSDKGYEGVWTHTSAQLEAMKERGKQLAELTAQAAAKPASYPETENIARLRAEAAKAAAKKAAR